MNRLQKKCFIASAGLHGLLVLLLVLGPALLPAGKKPEALPLLDFIPSKTVDALLSGGGTPDAAPPPPAQEFLPPPPPAPAPAPAPAPPPEPPPKPPVAEPKMAADFTLPEEKKKKEPPKKETSKTPETSKSPPPAPRQREFKMVQVDPKKLAKAAADAQKNREAERQQKAIGESIRNLQKLNSRPGVTIGIPGTGGEAYANFGQIVLSIYDRAWVDPRDVADDDLVAVVTVTILRDGTVFSAAITRPSGNAAMDKSVRAALDKVRYIAPFPAGTREDRRTYTINFSLKAKRLSG
jgi:TonB family protein